MTTAQYLQGAAPTQPSTTNTTNYLQGGSTLNPQQTSGNLQVTGNPMDYTQFSQPSAGVVQGATSPTTPYYDAEAAAASAAASAAEAAKAQRIAQANALKGGLTGMVNNIKSVYDAIYGDIDAVGADKTKGVQQRYNNERTAVVDQFNTDFPQIGNAYSARNTYDSSYRQDAEQGATKQFDNVQTGLATGRDEDLGAVGRFVATERAQVGADQSGLTQMQQLINASEDPDELTTLQQTLNDRINQVTASRAGMRSQDAYRAEANSLVSTADRSVGLRQNISNIVAGAAPAPLKRSVAMKLIQSSGLPEGEQQALVDDFERQLSGTTTNPEQQVVA